MNNDILTENGEYDIPSQILKTIFWIACLSYFLDPNMCFLAHL